MSAIEVSLLIFAILFVAAIAVGMTRWSPGNYERLRRVVAASDAAMRGAGGALGLEFVEGGRYEHPLVGTIPGFGMLRGSLGGVPLEARVEAEHEDAPFRTALSSEVSPESNAVSKPVARGEKRYRLALEGAKLTLYPNVPRTGSSHAYTYEVVTDTHELTGFLRELAHLTRERR